jgi:O-antigen/teichoic acid export membrane protein
LIFTVALIANAILNSLFIPSYAEIGAAAATMISFGVLLTLAMIHVKLGKNPRVNNSST